MRMAVRQGLRVCVSPDAPGFVPSLDASALGTCANREFACVRVCLYIRLFWLINVILTLKYMRLFYLYEIGLPFPLSLGY